MISGSVVLRWVEEGFFCFFFGGGAEDSLGFKLGLGFRLSA